MGMPQREGRPKLDLTPDSTPETASWAEQYNESGNVNNQPVPLRKKPAPHDGWDPRFEAYDTNQDKDI